MIYIYLMKINCIYYLLILNISCSISKYTTIKHIIIFTSSCVIMYKIINNLLYKKTADETLTKVNMSLTEQHISIFYHKKHLWIFLISIVISMSILYFIWQYHFMIISFPSNLLLNNKFIDKKNDTVDHKYSIKNIQYELENDIKRIKSSIKHHSIDKNIDKNLKNELIEKIKILKQVENNEDIKAIINIYKYILMSLYAETYSFINALNTPVGDILKYEKYCYELADKTEIPYMYDMWIYYKTR